MSTTRRHDGGAAHTILPAAVVVVAVLAQGVLATILARDGWFGVDALHYFAQRGGAVEPREGLFEPYAGHWQPALIIGYRVLFDLFGFSSYLPFVLPAILSHLGIGLVLYLLCIRCGAHRWAAAVAVWCFAFFGTGAEAFIADAPVALTGTVLMALLGVLMLVRRGFDISALVTATSLMLLALMFSVAGTVAVLFVASAALVLRGWRAAFGIVVVPAFTFIIWYFVWGRDAPRVNPTWGEVLRVPELALTLFTSPMGSLVPVPGAGMVLTSLLVVAPLLARAVPSAVRQLALAGLVAAVGQSLLSGLASVQLWEGAVEVGRYQYVVLAYQLPAFVVLVNWLGTLLVERTRDLRAPLPLVLAGMFAFLVTAHGLAEERAAWQLTRGIGSDARAWVLGGVAALTVGEKILSPAESGYTVHAHDIQRLADAGGASWPGLRASASDRLAAEQVLFTGVSRETHAMPAPAKLESEGFQGEARRGGCRTIVANRFDPELVITSFNGAQIAVTSQSRRVSAVLSRDGLSAEGKTWEVEPGTTVYIGTSAQLATLRVTFDSGGAFTICSG